MQRKNFKIMLSGVAAGTLLYTGSAYAGDINNNVFAVKESKSLSVMEGNRIFIEKDTISCFNSMDVAEELLQGRNGKDVTLNVIHKSDKNVQFRKETALHDKGHLELTVKIKVSPVTDNTAPRPMSYSFMIPAKVLDGMKYKAICGRASSWKPSEGEFGPANGKISECRYIVFGDGKNSFTFDFNPAGPYSSMDYPGVGEPMGYWSISHNGQYVNFTFGCPGKYYGTVFTGKVFIYKGSHEFEQKHSQTRWSYSANNSATGFFRQFSFGTTDDIKMFEKADCSKYSPEKKWGWAKTDSLELVKSEKTALTDNCVASKNGAADEFIIDVPAGVYVLTLRCGHNTLKTGPFSIAVNGKTVAGNVEIPAGKTQTMDFTEYLHEPARQIKIAFSGKNTWAVRSIIAQAVVFQNEDFSVTRKLWVMDKLYSPDLEYKNKENN